jgi:hypothetical protein
MMELVRSVKTYLAAILFIGLIGLVQASDDVVEATLGGTVDAPRPLEGPKSMRAAVAAGNAEAEKDIKSGRFRLRDCGKPSKQREIDEETGYRIERIGPCDQLPLFVPAEAVAYNRTMQNWHAKHHKKRPTSAIDTKRMPPVRF